MTRYALEHRTLRNTLAILEQLILDLFRLDPTGKKGGTNTYAARIQLRV